MLSTELSRSQQVIPRAFVPHALCDDGKAFGAINPTPGTGIAQTIQTSFSATNAVFNLRNGSTPGSSSPRYYLDYLRLICTVVGTSTVRSEGLVALDTGTARYGSGGSSLTVVNRNIDSAVTSQAVARFGALTMNAESGSARRIARFQLRTAIMVQYEEFVLSFGREGHGFGTLGGTTAQRNVIDCGPAVIGPGQDLIVHLWNPSNAATAPSWEVEACWYEA
jgi:hypothetical protein